MSAGSNEQLNARLNVLVRAAVLVEIGVVGDRSYTASSTSHTCACGATANPVRVLEALDPKADR